MRPPSSGGLIVYGYARISSIGYIPYNFKRACGFA